MAAAKTARSGTRASAAPANPHKGEITWQGLKLCLSMNALVEIEEGFGTQLADMGAVLAKPSMAQIRTILGALARGGGETMLELDEELTEARGEPSYREVPISDQEVGKRMADIAGASSALERAFKAAGVFDDTPSKGGGPGKS